MLRKDALLRPLLLLCLVYTTLIFGLFLCRVLTTGALNRRLFGLGEAQALALRWLPRQVIHINLRLLIAFSYVHQVRNHAALCPFGRLLLLLQPARHTRFGEGLMLLDLG